MAKKDDTMMYVLYAGAAFVAYRWAVSEGYLEDYFNLGTGAAGAGQQQIQAQQAAQQQQQNGGAPVDQVQQPPADAIAPPIEPPNVPPGGSGGGGGDIESQTRAASLNAANRRGGKMNWWEWNYFLPANIARPDWWFSDEVAWSSVGANVGAKPANSEEAAAIQLTFDQWWTLGSPLIPGLSGVHRGVGRVNHWGQAPSSGYQVH